MVLVAPEPVVAAHGGGPAVLRLGLVGCGAFARFSVAQYRRLPGVLVGGVADIDAAAAARTAAELDTAVADVDELLTSPEIDLVYIATPPAAHHLQARTALRTGRHVLVEKPLATTVSDARELAALADAHRLVCVANLLQRYNPLAVMVRDLIHEEVFGRFIHGLLVNEAADSGLQRRHWFWDRATSGGIFIEHGCHFFDLVAFWLGQGDVVAATLGLRPADGGAASAAGNGSNHGVGKNHGVEGAAVIGNAAGNGHSVEEQASCTCRYGDGQLFHFEHGFHQPAVLDRTEIRLVFERGELRLADWVPTHGTIRALCDEEAAAVLSERLFGGRLEVCRRFAAAERRMLGRFREFEASALVEINFGLGRPKLDVYAEAVRDLAADQVAFIRDPAHERQLTEADCVTAVAMACAADRLARAAGC
jgi:predicted dehydrogenase